MGPLLRVVRALGKLLIGFELVWTTFPNKDWRKAVGTLRDSKLAREADELGRAYREKQRKP